MNIRLATVEDSEAIYQIEEASFSVPWSLESITSELEDRERKLYVVVETEEGVEAYAGAWLVYDEGQITNIAVHPLYRRKGYGKLLTQYLMELCFQRGMNEIFLEVRVSNYPALALYRQLGFTVKGIRKDYYSEPKEDAYIMSLIKEEEQ
ncbi:ribosomal protein S18-alanine N-acetyltransferase [Veillonella agrestimuris]|uniref:ribosomal protein S18-alanine N-acetyltransferase n=1 Tax=Veillonella agrestimuris TaxID=2941340 RepID=UPI00203AEA91|nr:ribosomal protein S18-alanine N-acetyltransferase [Veillonella agrestimuris]